VIRKRELDCLAFAVVVGLLASANNIPAGIITVTNGNDTGPGSLRQAIVDVSPDKTINFAQALLDRFVAPDYPRGRFS
jgi:hypothetical protein